VQVFGNLVPATNGPKVVVTIMTLEEITTTFQPQIEAGQEASVPTMVSQRRMQPSGRLRSRLAHLSDSWFGVGSRTTPMSESSKNQPDEPASKQGRLLYRPILALATGGMANVELAIGIGTGNFRKLMVLKTLREELATDADMVAMFLTEARLCARLNHANLVHVFDVLEHPRPRIVMEYLEGSSMSAIHQARDVQLDTAVQLRIISEVLAGLHYAHELCDYDGTPLGIIHRDVSPQNVIITYDGRVKVLDFGIARVADSPCRTRAGQIKGKLSYMAPEQLTSEQLDRRTDVFAVGCMLWRAATGRKLWAKMSTSDIMRCLIQGEIPRPSTLQPVSPRLEEIIMRALAPDRAQRYASALALRADVDNYLAEFAPTGDVAKWVATAFETRRDEHRRVVQAILAGATSLSPVALTLDAPQLVNASKPSGALFKTVATGAVVALLVGGVALGKLQWGSHAVRTKHFVNTARDVPPAAQNELELRVLAYPATAKIFVDGTPAVGNPAVIRAAKAREHEITVSLDGYRTASHLGRFERDSSIEFVLGPLESDTTLRRTDASNATPEAKVKSYQPRAAPSVASGGRATPADPCEYPFYFEHGIKTYKPECL
jgi:eukaryotic-like serine/threonine-protein kinase